MKIDWLGVFIGFVFGWWFCYLLMGCGSVVNCPSPDQEVPEGIYVEAWIFYTDEIWQFDIECANVENPGAMPIIGISSSHFNCGGSSTVIGCFCNGTIVVLSLDFFKNLESMLHTVSHEMLHGLGLDHEDIDFIVCVDESSKFIDELLN